MASIYEKHGQPGRAYETYERMDDADPRVANRKREILTAAAVKLQRVFRGNKAREAMRKAARGRVARRQYGAVLAPRPIHNRGEGSGVVLADTGASYKKETLLEHPFDEEIMVGQSQLIS